MRDLLAVTGLLALITLGLLHTGVLDLGDLERLGAAIVVLVSERS